MIELLKEPVEPLVILGMDAEKYHATQAVSSTIIRSYDEEYDGCPQKAKYAIEGGDKPTTAPMEFGISLHALILEPDYFKRHFAVMDDYILEAIFIDSRRSEIDANNYLLHETYAEYQHARCRGILSMGLTKKLLGALDGPATEEQMTKIYEEVRKDVLVKSTYAKYDDYEAFKAAGGKLHAAKSFKRWWARQLEAGLQPVKPADLENLQGMQDSMRRNPEIMAEFQEGSGAQTEVSLFATIPVKVDGEEYHLPVKARLDWYFDAGSIKDLKSARSASQRLFSRQCGSQGYDRQAAWYWFVAKVCGLKVTNFQFLACESTPPYVSTLHQMPPDWIEHAHSRNLIVVGELARAIVADEWPGVPSGMMIPPPYLEDAITEWSQHAAKSITK